MHHPPCRPGSSSASTGPLGTSGRIWASACCACTRTGQLHSRCGPPARRFGLVGQVYRGPGPEHGRLSSHAEQARSGSEPVALRSSLRGPAAEALCLSWMRDPAVHIQQCVQYVLLLLSLCLAVACPSRGCLAPSTPLIWRQATAGFSAGCPSASCQVRRVSSASLPGWLRGIPACMMYWTEATTMFSACPCMQQGSAGASEDSFVSQALLPESATPDLLDYSLAWHLHSTLAAAGLWRSPTSSDQVRAKLCRLSPSSVASRPAS